MKEAGLARQGIPLVFKDYKVAGIQLLPPGEGAQGNAAKVSAARQYANHQQRNRLPELIIYLKDEPSVEGPEYFE